MCFNECNVVDYRFVLCSAGVTAHPGVSSDLV